MGIVRVLVDGYSLLHHWPELAPGRARHSFHARDALVAALTQYQDSSGTPVTLILGGSACSCENFLDMLNDTLDDMHVGVTQHNKRERKGYRRKD